VPTRFTEDRWVQAAEVRRETLPVVHHVISFVEASTRTQSGSQTDVREGGLESLTGVAPGEEPTILPAGVGILCAPGAVLIFQMHYTPNGVAQSDPILGGPDFQPAASGEGGHGGAAMNTDFAIRRVIRIMKPVPAIPLTRIAT